MNLRRQLILVSLLTLSLPWAGCQYIQEMEKVMREGQVIALAATATAVANRIDSETQLVHELQQPRWQQSPNQQLYVHPVDTPIMIDGYDDEWRHLAIEPNTFSDDRTPVQWQLSLGQTSDRFALFARVIDNRIFYHNPGLDALASGDHFRLRMQLPEGGQRDYVIRSGAPGAVTAYYRDGRRIRQEPRIRGYWQENAEGFQLELEWPRSLLGDTLGIALVNVDDMPERPTMIDGRPTQTMTRHWLGNVEANSEAPYWVGQSPLLHKAIEVFSSPGIRLRVVSGNHWLVGDVGHLQQPRSDEYETHGGLRWLYRMALGENYFPELNPSERSGRLVESEIIAAQVHSRSASGWYQWGVRRVGRAVVPLALHPGAEPALVVAEQSSDAMMALTNNAFGRLLFYTLLATLVTGAGLLAYATWLSIRIRRLSHAAATAVDDNGRINDSFPQSKAADEVGELTRHYGDLLERLRDYTDYLRTLSSKLSHELRTPLAVVRSSLDNLAHESLPESAETYARRALDGSERLSSILNAMSAASRVEASIEQAEKENLVLAKLVTQVGAAYNDMLEDCEVSTFVDERVATQSLFVAPDLLVQMLDKLVDNAADFCPPGGDIAIRLLPTANGVALSVSNDGPLLPDHMQHQLFDSLVSLRDQGKDSDKTHLGLGLHIVRLIVDFHGGVIKAANRDDLKGVIFTAYLPIQD